MIEIIIGIFLFIICFLLIRFRYYLSLLVGLILSVLLHKELFSIYVWDLLPIRVFMAAFLINSLIDFYRFNKFSLKFVEYLKDPYIFINLLLILSKLVSVFNSLSISSSINLNLFFIAISTFLISVYLKVKDAEILNLLKSYSLIGVVMALITFIQLYLYFQYSFLFGAVLNVAGRSVDIPDFSFSSVYFTEILKILVMTRVGSLFWDVNHFGGFVASTLVLSISFLVNSKDRKSVAFNLFSFVILGLVLFLTNSRSAWILAFVALFVFFISLIYRKIGKKGIVYALILISTISIFLSFQYQDRNSWFRDKVKSYFHYRLDSFDSHFLLLRGTIDVFDKYQLIGGGVGSFFDHFKSTETADEFLKRDPAGLSVKVPAHSIWGETLAETGLFGMISFILLACLIVCTSIYGIFHTDNEDFIYSSSVLGLSIGWLVAGIFYSYNSEFFYICFLLPPLYLYKKLNLKLDTLLDYFNKKYVYGFLLVMLISFSLVFYNLGVNKFIPYDEAIYAKVAKNVYETGDYLNLRWFPTTNWFEKPPLYFVITSLFYSIFGVSEFSGRLLTAICSIVLLIITYKFSKLFFANSKAALFSIISLVTNVSFLYYSRVAMLDVIFTLFIVTSCYFFIKFQKERIGSYLVVCGVMIGLAVLTKNILGLMPLGFFGVFYLIKLFKNRTEFKTYFVEFSKIFLTLLIISAPWHGYMYYIHGNDFISSYFGYHLFQRFETVIEQKGGPWYYYLLVIQNSMRIWYGLFILGFIYLMYKNYKDKFNELHLFLLYVPLIVLFLFSYSSSKLRWYIIPIYPFLSIIAGFFASEIILMLNKYFKRSIFNFLSSVVIIIGSLYYLYQVKDMVYTSDLTGRMVEMILLNNTQVINPAEIVYIDKVELPLILYYSEKKYKQVLYSSLRSKMLDAKDDKENVTFITSQSRFLDIQRIIPEVSRIGENKDFVLGSLKLD